MLINITTKYVSTASRPKGKRFATESSTVSRETKEAAWKLVCDTIAKASRTPTVALVDIEVRIDDELVWTLY